MRAMIECVPHQTMSGDFAQAGSGTQGHLGALGKWRFPISDFRFICLKEGSVWVPSLPWLSARNPPHPALSPKGEREPDKSPIANRHFPLSPGLPAVIVFV